VLASPSLEEAEAEEGNAATPEEELEDRITAEMARRGPLPNLSTFAFTATPKPKTLELFGTRGADGRWTRIEFTLDGKVRSEQFGTALEAE